MGLDKNNTRVPFDLKCVPDAYFGSNSKIFWGFPDTVGRGNSNLSCEAWIHDNYLIQFDNNYLFYVNIITRDYNCISLANFKSLPNAANWLVGAYKASGMVQPQLSRIINSNQACRQILGCFVELITLITKTVSSSMDQISMDRNQSMIENAIGGLKLNGRRWMADGREVTWGKVMYSMMRAMGVQKVW